MDLVQSKNQMQMSEKAEAIWIDGLIIKEGNFHKGEPHLKVSIKVVEFAKFVKEHAKENWLNLEIKTSKGGKVYGQLDTFVPKAKDSSESNDDLPF